MDILFKALPTELQWEILCVFVGSHVVRNNRLRRRLNGKVQREILANSIEYSKYRQLFPQLPPIFTIFNENKIPWLHQYQTVGMVHFSGGRKRILLKNNETEQLSDWYISYERWAVLNIDNLVLPPFVKHVYPAWESTDKKKGNIWQKVVLYDPRRNNPYYSGLGLDSWYHQNADCISRTN